MHHADLLGFHSSDTESHCCCCCSHRLPDLADDQPSGSIHQDDDCWLCDFFGQFHLVIEIEYEGYNEQAVAFAEVTRDQTADRWSVPPQARGPPRV